MRLINSDLGVSGIYRALLLENNKVYIPGVFNIKLINNDGSINENIYEMHKDAFPTAYFSAPNKKCTENEIPASCWVTFEGGDLKRPIIMGYLGDSIKTANISNGSGGATTSESGSSGGVSGGKDLQGGQIVDALFTAYYSTPDNYSSAENILQGGPTAANGETLDYTKNTCAAPKSVPFDTNIKVMDTGTQYDGVIYRVNDRGGAITIENGVYHFDLLMKDKTTAYDFGRRTGKAMIGGTIVETGRNIANTGSSVINYSNWRYPLSFKTEPGSAGYFGDARSNGRIHAGIDLYTKGNGKNYTNAPVYACESGIVVETTSDFLYAGVGSIAIKHADGSVIRYGEVNGTVSGNVTKGQVIGYVPTNRAGNAMIHFEVYAGTASGGLTNSQNMTYDYVPAKNYKRRRDLCDPSFVQSLPLS